MRRLAECNTDYFLWWHDGDSWHSINIASKHQCQSNQGFWSNPSIEKVKEVCIVQFSILRSHVIEGKLWSWLFLEIVCEKNLIMCWCQWCVFDIRSWHPDTHHNHNHNWLPVQNWAKTKQIFIHHPAHQKQKPLLSSWKGSLLSWFVVWTEDLIWKYLNY